jgi:uncharacterized membrane protein YbaN (DUF454 family)
VSEEPEGAVDRSRRLVLRAVGMVAVGLGLLGAFLPLLPTTPFVLLASACFARSSPRLNKWLHEHDVLGPPLRAWEDHRALPRRAKWTVIGLLWVSVPVSVYLLEAWLGRAAVLLVLLVGTALLVRVPTLEEARAGEAA